MVPSREVRAVTQMVITDIYLSSPGEHIVPSRDKIMAAVLDLVCVTRHIRPGFTSSRRTCPKCNFSMCRGVKLRP